MARRALKVWCIIRGKMFPRLLFRFFSRTHRMRHLLAAGMAFAIATASSVSLADVIYLKNGRKIVAEVTREDSKQVFYQRGAGEFAIPRTLVERIEKSPLPMGSEAPAESSLQAPAARDLPLPLPPAIEPSSGPQSLVIKNDTIDEAYLRQLDQEVLWNPSPGSRHRLARGYHEAAIFLTRKGNPEAAIEKYRHALIFAPDDLALTLALAYLLVKQNHHGEAIELLLPAAERFPRSPDIPLLLGSAYYASEELPRAIDQWKKALAIEDNPRLRETLAKVEQERNVVSLYQEARSEHFLLRYEGRDVKELADEILKALEATFRDLQRDLDFYPRETIVVVLYPNQAFRDIARSPSWVGAMNDGKIRMPVSGLTKVTVELARVLKHELTHSFVRQAAVGRCPVWFNEGLAQLEEGATTAGHGSQLARALIDGRVPPLAGLETSFMNMPEDQVGLAYGKSLAALEYLRETYGLDKIRRLLKLMASNPSFSSLLQQELQVTYQDFEQAVATYLVKRYGS